MKKTIAIFFLAVCGLFSQAALPALAADPTFEAPAIGGWGPALESFIVILREGFEAMLIVTALLVYVRRSDEEMRSDAIWWGVGAALLASIATAWAMETLFSMNGESRGALEGLAMLAAAAILFYVSYWLLAKREADRWAGFVRSQVDKAVRKGSRLAIGAAAFFAVYREGAETVLFFQALLTDSAGHESAVWMGFASGLLGLGVMFIIFREGVMRVPIGLFFSITAVFLYFLAVRFTGKGIHELQEAGWIMQTFVDGFPKVKWMGFYPTIETMFAQTMLLMPAAIAAFVLWRRKQRTVEG